MQGTTRILQDSPAEIDEFGGKGHDRTANALVDALNQMQGRDGAVGLEGSWGAGKSTVIRIAQKKLAALDGSNLKHSIFTFDLWAHQSDDFRRAFLESFVAWLAAQKMLASETLDKARDEIRDRVKSVTVESTKKYNAFGIVFILILPLLPFIYSWLGPSALKPPSDSTSSPSWPFHVALTLVAVLYGSVAFRFVNLFYVVDWRHFRFSLARSGKSFSDAASNCVSMFSRDVESETTKQNIRETDPTTIEFHRIFRNLLSGAQSRGICIINVLDNIDRLPKDSVANTWSEVRALFAIRGGPGIQPHDNVLVVLPYDKKFVMNALGEEGEDKEADFIEKTFSRTLRVAPPISHDWRSFFLAKLKDCFSKAIDEELSERLFRLLRYSFQKTSTHASPRRIIHFVNELGALDAQWQRTISLEACAVYILNRKEIESKSDSLQKEGTIHPRYVQIANVDDIHREIAALAFNVEPAAANQVLLQDPIAKALISSRVENLRKLATVPGFDDVLQDVLQEPSREWLLTPEGVLDRVCVNLAGLQLDDARAKVCWRDIASDIQKSNIAIWPDIDVVKAFSLAISGIRSPLEAPQLARKIQSILGGTPQEIEQIGLFDYGVAWFSASMAIQESLQAVVTDDVFKEFRQKTIISLNSTAILGCAHHCAQSGNYRLSDVHQTQCDRQQLEQSFINLVNSKPSIALAVLNQLSGYFSIDNFERLQIEILSILKTNALGSNEDEPKRAALLQIAKMLCLKMGDGALEKWKALVKPLTLDGSLALHARAASEAGDKSSSAQAVAMLMALQDSTKPYPIPSDHPQMGSVVIAAVQWFNDLLSEGTDDAEFIALIAKASPDLSPFGNWLRRGLPGDEATILYAQVLREIIRTVNMTRLNSYETLGAYPEIKTFIGDDEVVFTFLRNLQNWNLSFKSDKAKLLTFSSILIADIQAQAADTSLNIILESIDKVVLGATQEEWQQAFSEQNDLLRLLIIRQKDTALTPPVSEYRPALLDHAVSLLKGGTKIKKFKQDWQIVVDGLGQHNQTTLAGDVLLALSNIVVNDEGLLLFIECYREIADRMKFSEYPNISLNQVYSKLIVSPSPIATEFIDRHLNEIDALLMDASNESRGAFIETIKSQSISDRQDADRLIDLRKRFRITDDTLEEERDGENNYPAKNEEAK